MNLLTKANFHKTHWSITLWFVTTSLLLVGSQVSYAQSDNTSVDQIIRVSATGTAYGEPDIATVRLGVSLTGDALDTVLSNANSTAEAVVNVLIAAGIAQSDIRTSAFNVFEEQTFNPMTGEAEAAGYRVTNVYAVTVRDVTALGSLLSEALAAGANRIQDVHYSVSEPSALARQAREQAVGAARAKAEHLAELAGVTLAEVVMIQETSSPVNNPSSDFSIMNMMASEATMNVPTASGQLAVQVRVDMAFKLAE
ncbi:MAG: SIMPL domain-containing protein [Deinococcota bacterium]